MVSDSREKLLGQSLTEKELKEKAAFERLEKRATVIMGCITRFLASYKAARNSMLLADKESRALKALGGKKKGKKSKKPDAGGKKADGKKTKTLTNPIQDSWIKFEGELDERINKNKSCGLEDLYRGVSKLSQEQQREFSNVINSSNNKKVLPTEGVSVPLLGIRMALFSAAAAFDMRQDKAVFCTRLIDLVKIGASDTQILTQGFSLADSKGVGRDDDSPSLLLSLFSSHII